MIACDIDGTLLDYNYIPGQPPKVNAALLEKLTGKKISLVSNQGGLPFGWQQRNRTDGRKYPQPADFAFRLRQLSKACAEHSISIEILHVCLYHPKASEDLIDAVRDILWANLDDFPCPAVLYTDSEFRKPKPAMLIAADSSIYYGDSDEDEQAAKAAGIEFVRVARFV